MERQDHYRDALMTTSDRYCNAASL